MPKELPSQLALSTFLNADFDRLEKEAARCLGHTRDQLVYRKTVWFSNGRYRTALVRHLRDIIQMRLNADGRMESFRLQYDGTLCTNGELAHRYVLRVQGARAQDLLVPLNLEHTLPLGVGERVYASFGARCPDCRNTVTLGVDLCVDEGVLVAE